MMISRNSDGPASSVSAAFAAPEIVGDAILAVDGCQEESLKRSRQPCPLDSMSAVVRRCVGARVPANSRGDAYLAFFDWRIGGSLSPEEMVAKGVRIHFCKRFADGELWEADL